MRLTPQSISAPFAENRAWNLFLLTLLVLHVLPVWIFPYFPSQDGPSHVYNASLLLQYLDHGNYQLHHFFDVHFALVPNLCAQLLLPALMLVWDPLTAQRILISLIVILLPLSVLYAGRHFEKRPTALLLGSFIFCYHNFVHMGFFSFSLASSLCIFTVGYWLRIRSRITLPRLCAFFTLGYLTFLTHFAPFGAMLAIIVATYLYDITRLLTYNLARSKSPRLSPAGITSLSQAVVQAYALSPFLFIGLYVRTTASPANEVYKGFAYLLEYARDNLTLVTFTGSHIPVVTALWGLICTAIVVNIATRLARKQYCSERDLVLASFGLLAFFYFTEPWAALGSQWVNERIALLAMVIGFLWFERFPRILETLFGCGLAVLAVWQLILFSRDYSQLQPELEELTMATGLVQPHSTLGYQSKGSYSYKLSNFTQYVSPFDHMAEYYALQKDVAFVNNYEANWSLFLVNWKNYPDSGYAPDYLLQSHYGIDEHDQNIYDVIFRTPRVTLLQRKASHTPEDAWADPSDGRIRLVLDFGTQDRELAARHFEVSPRKSFANGFGWVHPVNTFQSSRDSASGDPESGFVRSSDDAAFRIELPDGRYRVTCRFPADTNGFRQINVIANDQAVLTGEVLEPSTEVRQFAWEVDVSGQRLDQVFYTTWGDSNDFSRLPYWSLSTMEIISVAPVQGQPGRDTATLEPGTLHPSLSANAPTDAWLRSDSLKMDSVRISQAFATQVGEFGSDLLDTSDPLNDPRAVWKEIPLLPDWYLDLDFSHYFEDTDFHTVYVVCEIRSATNSDVRLNVGSDDGVTLWLNGAKLLESLNPRMARPTDDSVDLHLKKGGNLLLFRVNNVAGAWRLLGTLE